MPQTKIERIQELVKQLNIYRNEYYNLNKPSVSDSIYDKLFDEISALEQNENFVLSNSPTQTVGYPIMSKLNKVEHSIPLLSLNKTKSIDELKKFIGNKDCLLMLKGDGLTCELIYDNGELVQASTRGNGIIGEEITFNAKVFKNIPLKINWQGRLKITGEAVIHKNDFEEINSKLSDDEKYATPRNLSAGSCRQLNSKICASRNVYFYAFNILECNEKLSDSKFENFNWLYNLGFSIIPTIQHFGKDEWTEDHIKELKEIAEDKYIPIDGIVASFNFVKYSNSLGEVAHHPLFSMAFKFKDEAEITILREIEWSVGRTGVITPVAIFDKVLLDNTEVTRASVHNLSIMEGLDLGIGDSISIVKCNMIIPQIEENFTRSNNMIIPEKCPVCGGITIIDQMNESKILYCTNEDCSAKLLKKFSHFVSRDAMNIEGLSEATLEKFLDENYIETFSDIYRLEKYKTKIITTEGFGLRSYTKLIEAIEKSKNIAFENFINSLGIDQIGKGSSKRLAKHFNNDILVFLEATKSSGNFMSIADFGEITANAVYDYFKNEENMKQVLELLTYVDIKKEEKKITGFKSLEGLSFVVTGNVTTFKNRGELEGLITSLSGKLNNSVSSKTNFLINNDTTSTSGKNQKAMELGVKLISEAVFNSMIGK